MITNETVKDYILKMYGNDLFINADMGVQDKIVFSAHEILKDNYDEELLTNRIVSLQTLYMLEGEDEEYAKLKRHGVKSYRVKDVSIDFNGTSISPEVLSILPLVPAKPGVGKVARLI